MIQFKCSQCARKYQVKDEYAGKRVKCKACETINTIPAAKPVEKPVGGDDSIAAYNQLLQELSKYEKQAPAIEVDS